MTINPLPPQAYTKETLSKAYTWLLGQPMTVKELATSQDMLVSLYLKAKRNGDASLETPSIQNFKQELKSLAHLMGDFQNPTLENTKHIQKLSATSEMVKSEFKDSAIPTANETVIKTTITILTDLDAQSLNAIAEVRSNLNLGSDLEALRALISLGHKQYKKI